MARRAPESVRVADFEDLVRRLGEAEQALEAIRTGKVESLVVEGPDGPRIFSLQSADHSYRVLVEAMNEGAATIGNDGVILYCNVRFAAMLEAPLEQVMGSDIWRFLPDTAFTKFDTLVRAANDAQSRGELELRGAKGRVVPILLSVSLIVDENRPRLCLIATDITESKRAETVLREMNSALAAADSRKNEFIAVLSHELRNPLAPITNSLAILDASAPGSENARIAQAVVKRQVEQLVRLVDDLLDVTRITRNKVQLTFERLDLAEVVRETAQDHRATFEERGVRLEVALPSGPVVVKGDRARLKQVVGNLLANAAKFTGAGGATRVSIAADVRGQAVVRVFDTGAGMSPEILARLFEPFAQADRTLDRTKGGLGLGLALVKGLVDLHGGEVRGESAGAGQGAEFTVRLPLDLSDAPVAVRVPETIMKRPWRILVIEDNVDSAESLRMVLEARDHEVEVAYAGGEGLAVARRFRPELVLCDIGLPGMDGYDVARAFREDEELKDTLLVALSGYAMPDDLTRASDAGFDSHLAKPLRLEKLEALLTMPTENERTAHTGH